MTSKQQVKIYGMTYTVKETEGDVPLPKLASYVDSKMKELAGDRKIPPVDLAVLAALNIAQELMEIKNNMKTLSEENDKVFNEVDQRVAKMTKALSRELEK